MLTKNVLAEKHNVANDTLFKLKSFILVIKRGYTNLVSPVRKYTTRPSLQNASIISLSESELWNANDNEKNWILTAGKIENLRIAVKKIHGIEVPANNVFSFWKHLGNPNMGKGYVIGREIREGCIVPTKGGGLCQLSNGLYDAALKANFEIIERHRHTKVIKGSLAEKDRDATVKWNYVDLRFRSSHAFRIEAELTSEKLIIQFKSLEKNTSSTTNTIDKNYSSSKLNDCYSCGNTQCFKHPTGITNKQMDAVTTFILDEKWKEYDEYIGSIKKNNDVFILPWSPRSLIKMHRYSWESSYKNPSIFVPIPTINRTLKGRLYNKLKKNVFATQLKLDAELARSAASKIPIECTHVVISQNLLPFILETGVLAGRTYDILMTRLPIEKMHTRLDLAHTNHTESKTLHDYRADESLIKSENTGLTKARKIITPHTEIASIFVHKSILLPWNTPPTSEKGSGSRILFPGTTIGRKGAYEVRKLAKELGLSILIQNNIKEHEQFWDGIAVEYVHDNIFKDISLILYPTYIENQPRLILKALAKGITVVTTTACGLPPMNNLVMVSPGDYNAFKNCVKEVLEKKLSYSSSIRN